MKSNINVLIKQTVSVVVIAFFLSLQGQTYAQNILVEPNGNITQADPSALGQRITHERISSKLACKFKDLLSCLRKFGRKSNDDNALLQCKELRVLRRIISFTIYQIKQDFLQNDRNIVHRKTV